MTRLKGASGALAVAALLTGVLLVETGSAGATTSRSSATDTTTADPDVPVLGQAIGQQSAASDDKRDALVSLHGVRRTESSTVVYWSAGWTPDTESGDRADLTNTFSNSTSRLGLERPHGDTTADVAVVDTEGLKAYTPVIDDGSCYCSDFLTALPSEYGADVEPPAGKAYVMYAILPELPQGLKTTTLKVAGKVFTDVPVEDGEMTPEVDEEDEPILVGTGWPKLDPASIGEVGDLDRFVYPLSKNSEVLDSAVSSREEADQTSIDIAADVLFDVDEATLTGKAKQEIRAAARELKEATASGTVTITGHTDSDGADDHNQDLSERRAKAVAKEITPQLPDGVKATTAGKGETEPIASNDSDAGKAKNRRVTVTVPGGDS